MPKSAIQKQKQKVKRKEKRAIMKVAKLERKIEGHGAYKMRIPRNKIRGKGGYFWDKIKEYGGKALRGAITGVAGNTAGDIFNQITGLGKYKVRRNALLMPGTPEHANYQDTSVSVEALPEVGRPPSFGTDGTGSDIVFTHSEYVADIQAQANFTSTTYLINPGNPVLFPWLSQIASLYEMYEMLGLVLQVRTTCLNATTAGLGVGTINIATEYDVYDNGFDNKKAMDACEFASSSLPTENQLHPIECDPKRSATRMQYVEPGISSLVGIQGDARLDFMGATTVASVGQPSAYDGQIVGELWVSYKVRLSRPVLENNLVTTNFTQHVTGTLSASNGTPPAIVNNNVAGGVPFGLTFTGTSTHTQLTVANTNGLEGEYFMMMHIVTAGSAYGGTTLLSNSIAVVGGMCNLLTTWTANNQAYGITGVYNTSAANTVSSVYCAVNFTGTGTVAIAIPDIATYASTYDFIILPYSSIVTKQLVEQKRVREDPLSIKLEDTKRELVEYKANLNMLMEEVRKLKHGKCEVDGEETDHIGKLLLEQDYCSIDSRTCSKHSITYKAKLCPMCAPF